MSAVKRRLRDLSSCSLVLRKGNIFYRSLSLSLSLFLSLFFPSYLLLYLPIILAFLTPSPFVYLPQRGLSSALFV